MFTHAASFSWTMLLANFFPANENKKKEQSKEQKKVLNFELVA